ncbi:hypothetical protein Pelo_3705 [Pelomyxa schiedti]|nr:hypothetical protein Pelo_3705 [Pelomyxa schiedti]
MGVTVTLCLPGNTGLNRYMMMPVGTSYLYYEWNNEWVSDACGTDEGHLNSGYWHAYGCWGQNNYSCDGGVARTTYYPSQGAGACSGEDGYVVKEDEDGSCTELSYDDQYFWIRVVCGSAVGLRGSFSLPLVMTLVLIIVGM